MRKQIFKKTAAMMAAMLLFLTSVLTVSAASIETVGESSTIKLHLYGSNSNSGQPGTGTENPPLPTDAKPLSGATFRYAQVGEVVQYNDGKEVGLRYKITNMDFANALGIVATDQNVVEVDNHYYIVPDTLMQSKMASHTSTDEVDQLIETLKTICNETTSQTDQNGLASVTNAQGLYVFMGGTMPPSVTTVVTPFLVAAPMPNQDGTGWNKDIHVYPKVSDDPIKVVKTATQGNRTGDRILVESGSAIQYKVEVTIPGGTAAGASADFTQFALADQMSAGLTQLRGQDAAGNQMSSLSVLDKDGKAISGLTVKDKGIEIIPGSDNKTRLKFTEQGLQALSQALKSGNVTLTLTYQAILGSGATLGHTGNTNTAIVTYQREHQDAVHSVQAAANVHTYGIDLTKQLSDGKGVEKNTIAFTLTKNGESTPMKVAEANGAYWVKADATDGTLNVPEGGELKIYGLLPGKYVLTETKTASGYSKLAKPIQIEITAPDANSYGFQNASAKADGESMVSDATNAFKLTVINTRQTTGFTLPMTGESGTLAALVIGFGLVCFAVVTLAAYRTKNRKTNHR